MSKKISKNRVLFYDSGVGGLTLLCEARKNCPNIECIYFADYLNMPLGDKPLKNIQSSIKNTIEFLVKKFGTGVVVLACNTATSVAIKLLREAMPQIEFVGTEPAVKKAVDLGYKRILLLATPNTIKYNRLVRKMRAGLGENLILCPEPRLAQIVENNVENLTVVKRLFDEKKAEILAKKPDVMVLGCTHYVWLKGIIQKVLGLPCIDGNEGVINRLKSVANLGKNRGKLSIYTNDVTKTEKLKIAWEILNSGGE